MYARDGRAKFVCNVLGSHEFATTADEPIPSGRSEIRMDFKYDGAPVSHLRPGGALWFATVDLAAARGRRRRRGVCRTKHTAECLPDADARHPETMVA